MKNIYAYVIYVCVYVIYSDTFTHRHIIHTDILTHISTYICGLAVKSHSTLSQFSWLKYSYIFREFIIFCSAHFTFTSDFERGDRHHGF